MATKAGIGLAVEDYSESRLLLDVRVFDDLSTGNARTGLSLRGGSTGTMRNLEIINNTFNGNGHDSVLIDANRFAGTNTSRNGVFGDRSVESTWCWRARQRYLGYDAHSLPLSRQHGPGMARTPRRAAAVVMLRFGVSPRGAFR